MNMYALEIRIKKELKIKINNPGSKNKTRVRRGSEPQLCKLFSRQRIKNYSNMTTIITANLIEHLLHARHVCYTHFLS